MKYVCGLDLYGGISVGATEGGKIDGRVGRSLALDIKGWCREGERSLLMSSSLDDQLILQALSIGEWVETCNSPKLLGMLDPGQPHHWLSMPGLKSRSFSQKGRGADWDDCVDELDITDLDA